MQKLFVLLLGAFLFCSHAGAQTIQTPEFITFDGILTDSSGNPITTSTPVIFSIKNPANSCVLYKESISITPSDDGSFTHKIGNGSIVFGPSDIRSVFDNMATLTCEGGGNYSAASTDTRIVAITVNGDTLSPAMTITSVPWAHYADHAKSAQSLDGILGVEQGGTGLDASSAANGQLLIGTGSGFSLANLTAGSGVTIANSAGGIQISATSGGDITEVTAGTGLTGGGTTGAVSLSILDGGVTTAKLADGNVTTAKLADNSVDLTGTKVTGALPPLRGGTGSSIDGTTLANGDILIANSASETFQKGTLIGLSGLNVTYNAGNIDLSIDTSNISIGGDISGDLSNAQIATGVVGTVEIADGSITNADISASAAIVDSKLAIISSAGKVANSATTATASNTPSAIVARDASGNFAANNIQANSIGIGTATPDASAAFEINSSTKGFLLPRMTSTQRGGIAGVRGLQVYDIDNNSVYYHNGSAWINMSAAVSGDITDVTAGAGLTGGGATGAVSLDIGAGTGIIVGADSISVDVGNSANKIVQLDASARLPAVDGSQLTNLSAANLAGVLPPANGGTGLSTLGSPYTVLGVDAAGFGMEYKSITAGSGISLSNSTGNITISATGGGGTVTSVGLSMPSIFAVSGSPVTGSGTLAATLTSQAANTFFAGPSGASGPPAFRSLDALDIPNLDASKITTGVLPVSRGGTGQSIAPAAGEILIGNGSGFDMSPLTSGTGISITSGAGSITVSADSSTLSMGGDLSGSASNAQIITGAVTTTEIADGTISSNDLSSSISINTTGSISAQSVSTSAQISSNTYFLAPQLRLSNGGVDLMLAHNSATSYILRLPATVPPTPVDPPKAMVTGGGTQGDLKWSYPWNSGQSYMNQMIIFDNYSSNIYSLTAGNPYNQNYSMTSFSLTPGTEFLVQFQVTNASSGPSIGLHGNAYQLKNADNGVSFSASQIVAGVPYKAILWADGFIYLKRVMPIRDRQSFSVSLSAASGATNMTTYSLTGSGWKLGDHINCVPNGATLSGNPIYNFYMSSPENLTITILCGNTSCSISGAFACLRHN